VIFVYVFCVLACMWFVEIINVLIHISKKLFKIIENLDIDHRKDIYRLSITLFILILSSITNFALGLNYCNNSEYGLSLQKALQVDSKGIQILYILATVFLIICYICALIDPKKSVIPIDDKGTKIKIEFLNFFINFFLIFNLIMTPISIVILITQPLSLQYLTSKVELLGMLNNPIKEIPFLLLGALFAEIIIIFVSVFVVVFNFVFVLFAALFSLWLLIINLKRYE